MEKKAKTGSKKTANKLKTAAAIVAISTAVACEQVEQPVAEWAAPVRKYAGDVWELQNAIQNGFLSDIQPTGNFREDVSKFLFTQGGGKSRDTSDQICQYPNAWPKTADKDGFKYHTVNDITHVLYMNPTIYNWVGYEPTDENFYEMPDWIRNGIIDYHINLGNISTSQNVNMFAAYCLWGGGGYDAPVKMFRQQFGELDNFIQLKGDYFVFYNLLAFRKTSMQQSNFDRIWFIDENGVQTMLVQSNTKFLSLSKEQLAHNSSPNKKGYYKKTGGWPTYGTGWSNGLAQFHRVFKVYCI